MNTIKLKDATIIDVLIEHDLWDTFMSDIVECLYDVTLKLDNGTSIAIESYSESFGPNYGIMSLKDLFFNLVIVDNTERTFAEIFMDTFVPNIYGGCVMTISSSNQHKDTFTIKTELDDNFNSIITSPDYPNLSSDELLATISDLIK